MTCYKPGERSRLITRPRRNDDRRDGRKEFAWADCRDLPVTAHQQFGSPIVLIWDNLNVHLTAGMRRFIDGLARTGLSLTYTTTRVQPQ
ncbi:transposase [Streptomyces antibioticus]|uniref:transposase n=1 Tax=Streptomyces antibioticus TaxID=1890 RepID=UPI003715C917